LTTVTTHSRAALSGAVLAISVALCLTACGGGQEVGKSVIKVSDKALEPPRALEIAPFFIPGERLRWKVSMHGIAGAESVLVVGEPGEIEGRRAIIVKSRALTTGLVQIVSEVKEENTTWIDLVDNRPTYRYGNEKYGDERRVIETRFAADEVVFDAKRPGRPAYSWKQKLPEGHFAHDVHSVMGLLRAWEPVAGQQVFFYSITDEILRRHTVHLGGYENVRTDLGTFAAIRLEVEVHDTNRADGSLAARNREQDYTMWISHDATRRPLRMKVFHRLGRIELDLVAYAKP
jgi:hypothetical protein